MGLAYDKSEELGRYELNILRAVSDSAGFSPSSSADREYMILPLG